MKLSIIGMGYIGVPTAAMFAESGHHVLGVDISEKKVNVMKNLSFSYDEPGLNELVKKHILSGNLRVSTKVEKSDAFIIAVPTPMDENKNVDISYVKSAAESIAPFVEKGNIVVLESTSPPLTTENIVKTEIEKHGLRAGDDFYLAYSPERIIPGNMLEELLTNDRILGAYDENSAEKVKALYKSFVKSNIYTTDCKTAEMCKLAENTYRAVNIALANELAQISESIGINAWELISLANKHPRVNILRPGPGVGGHCIAIDPWFIAEREPELSRMIKLSMNINLEMPELQYERIREILGDLSDKKITFLGMTFKANTDDYRSSPILDIVSKLEKNCKEIAIFDPKVKSYRLKSNSEKDAFQDSDLVVLGVEHEEFKNLDYKELFKYTKTKKLFDTRNFLSHLKNEIPDLEYYLLGCKNEI